MKIAYLSGRSGAGGDMIVAAFLDAGVPAAAMEKELRKIPLAGYRAAFKREERPDPRIGHGRAVGRFLVEVEGHEHGRAYRDIVAIFRQSALEETTRARILAVFQRLADAEKEVHGRLPEHFHQVGETDSLVDVAAAVICLELSGAEKLYCSPLQLGNPAPATTIILRGRPVLADGSLPEATTPTAAAFLAETAVFDVPPQFTLAATGSGAGTRAEPAPNTLELFLGEAEVEAHIDEVTVLETNLDDMPPHAYETLFDRLMAAGALDLILLPGLMKKNRPGQKLEVIARRENAARVAEALFTHSTALGLRTRTSGRLVLAREFRTVRLAGGDQVRFKIGRLGGREVHAAPEYEDLRAAAEKSGRTLGETVREAWRAYEACFSGPDATPPTVNA